jgi:hypothetical protein
MNETANDLVGASAAGAILGIPSKHGKASGTVYRALERLEPVLLQVDGKPVKTWRRSDVEALRETFAEKIATYTAPIVRSGRPPRGVVEALGRVEQTLIEIRDLTETLVQVWTKEQVP